MSKKNQKNITMLIKNNPAPAIVGEAPQVPPPFERNLLPHEKKGKEQKQKLQKRGGKNPQYKRTQKK